MASWTSRKTAQPVAAATSYDALLPNPVSDKISICRRDYSFGIARVVQKRTFTAGAEIELVIKMPSSEIWAIEIKHGVAPKLGKHYSQTCDDVGAMHKYILYSGDDEFPVGKDVKIMSLAGLTKRLHSG